MLTKDKEGNFTQCRAKIDDGCNFCICNGLLSSAGYNPEVEEPLYTVGVNGYRIDKLTTVKELMNELTGKENGAAKVAESADREAFHSVSGRFDKVLLIILKCSENFINLVLG